MIIKTLIITLAMAATALAGTEVRTAQATDYEYYKTGEFQVDAFGVYAHTYGGGGHPSYRGCRNQRDRDARDRAFHSRDNDAFGGGVAANYFFTKYLGVGVDGYYLPEKSIGQVAGSIIARYPMGHFAPYAIVGGGGLIRSSQALALGKAGLGAEYKFTPNLGLKADYTWNIAQHSPNFGVARVGLSYNF